MKEALKCDIFEVSLDDAPKYEALSYTWKDHDGDENQEGEKEGEKEEGGVEQPGKAKQGYNIECNQSSIPISSNLSSALFRLRHVQASRILWIDQVCINQDDELEKADRFRVWQISTPRLLQS